MEHALSCNNLKCRISLTKRAIVTTCSHIFCLDCAHQFGLTGQSNASRPRCPACKSELPAADDVVITNLKPSEDYKTSVLSGLSPSIIMECAGRALSFWAYQTTQDIHYHHHLYKTARDKYSNHHARMEESMNDASSHIELLQSKLEGMADEHEVLRKKNDELAVACRDRDQRLLQLQELYDKDKRQAEIGNIQQAASDAVDRTLHDSIQHPRTGSIDGTQPLQNFSFARNTPPRNQVSHFHSPETMNTGLPRVNPIHVGDDARWTRPMPTLRAGSMNGMMNQRLGSAALPGPPNSHGFEGSSAYGRTNVGRPAETSVPSFASNRAGLSGMGLTSGLRVSQPASNAGLNNSSVRRL